MAKVTAGTSLDEGAANSEQKEEGHLCPLGLVRCGPIVTSLCLPTSTASVASSREVGAEESKGSLGQLSLMSDGEEPKSIKIFLLVCLNRY